MRRHLSEPVDPPAASVGLGAALGLTASDDDRLIEARETMIRAAALLWPLAGVALLLVPGAMIVGAMLSGNPALATELALRATPAILLAPIVWGLLALPGSREMPPHRRIVSLAVTVAAISLSLCLLLEATADVDAMHRPAVAAALFGAMILTVIAAHPVRAATLSFAVTLAVMMLVTAGLTLASMGAALIAALLAAGAVRISRAEQVEQAQGARTTDAAARALRLVAEFENNGSGWFWQTDRFGRVTYLSDRVAREVAAYGIAPVGEPLSSIFRVDSALLETERTLTFHLSSRTSFSGYSVRPASDDTADRWWSISGRPMMDDIGRFQGFIGSGSDLTEKRRAEAEITRLALFDSLTGLANRQRMRLSLEQTLSPQTGGMGATGLLLLDLDRFKAVNDTLGHQMGDELLKLVAQRLQRTVGDAGLVGRLGGDEFQVLVPREGDRERLAKLADSIIAALSLPFYIEGSTLSIGCSIGVAIANHHGETPETLIRNADLALYAAKADGRGVHRFYRDELLEGAQNRKRLEDDLRHALKHDQLHLTYQPVVSTQDERIVGYEALLRWEHPQRGPISPAEFVPVAEECGLIEQIGEWVLRTATLEAASWPRHVRVAVNVSPIQFANPALPGLVTSAIATAGIAADRLELEITEGVFLNESASSEQMFKSLKAIGVRLALDDFGTGYSSLGYLKKAPFDKIKIDQSFVRGAIQPGNRNAAIIKAIVSLAQTLHMETTAEGVEQQDEIAMIRELGCSHIQGFVYGRPARCETVREQLVEHGGRAMAIGFKTSRASRHKMLRSARLELGDEAGEVRIRDISVTGVMIDGVDLPAAAIGHRVMIELTDDQLVSATIRWADDGRAGLQFTQAVDLERLTPGRRAA